MPRSAILARPPTAPLDRMAFDGCAVRLAPGGPCFMRGWPSKRSGLDHWKRPGPLSPPLPLSLPPSLSLFPSLSPSLPLLALLPHPLLLSCWAFMAHNAWDLLCLCCGELIANTCGCPAVLSSCYTPHRPTGPSFKGAGRVSAPLPTYLPHARSPGGLKRNVLINPCKHKPAIREADVINYGRCI